jgi:hypothetical protein
MKSTILICSTCGTDNSPDARTCLVCKHRLIRKRELTERTRAILAIPILFGYAVAYFAGIVAAYLIVGVVFGNLSAINTDTLIGSLQAASSWGLALVLGAVCALGYHKFIDRLRS